jgi:hypothetical protein
MHAAVAQYLPLAAWVALLLATSLVTWTVYKFTARASRDVAKVTGQIGTLAITFGGPVALFVALAWVGKGFIPSETLVRLDGEVLDINAKPVANVWVASAARAGRTDANGKFSVTVPSSINGQHDLVAFSEKDFKFEDGMVVTNPNEVKIADFPDPDSTVLVARDLSDRDGKLIGGVRVYVEPVARPQGPEYQPGADLTISIERRKYSVVLKDAKGNVLSREQFLIEPGKRFQIPSEIAENERHQ